MKCGLTKNEILRGHNAFRRVFMNGDSIVSGSVRCFFILESSDSPRYSVGFTVSRSIRSAVLRNRIKRLLRESFRLNKSLLPEIEKVNRSKINIIFLFTGNPKIHSKLLHYNDIEPNMRSLLENLSGRIRGAI